MVKATGKRLAAGMMLLLTAAGLSAQAAGTMAGRATDESGSALPGVTVEASKASLPAGRAATTDRSGSYSISGLAAGLYDVSFRIPNFATVIRKGVAVSDGAVARVDAVLSLAASADVVVTAKKTFRNLADVSGAAESLIGVALAGTEGAGSGADLDRRPILRPGEVLETVPGLVISQHSGEGKANQYYLRGFNLDHGTDFATTVGGVPVNMPSHAHGQGYSDLNFLIPELVSGVQYRHGPDSAAQGDFSTAGSADIRYVNELDEAIARAGAGADGFARVLAAQSPRLGDGRLLYAFEVGKSNGPWVNPSDLRRYNGVLR